jgi:hypothetical protein
VPELGHHAEVVADGDVLGVHSVAETEDVTLAHRDLTPGGREGDGLAVREDHEWASLRAAHPDVRDRAVIGGDHLDDLEPQAGERRPKPRAGRHQAGYSGQPARRWFLGGHVVDMLGMDDAAGTGRVAVGDRIEVELGEFFG